MGQYIVPYTRQSDGATFEIPVTAQSPEDAATLLQLSIDQKQFDPETLQSPAQKAAALKQRNEGRMKIEVPGGQDLSRTWPGQSVANGFKKGLLDVASTSAAILDWVTPDGTDANASAKAIRNKWEQYRAEAKGKQDKAMQEAFGTTDNSFVGQMIGESIALLPLNFTGPAAEMPTFMQMLKYNGAVGGIAAGISGIGPDQSAGNFLENVTAGAAFGVGLSSLGLLRGIRSWGSRQYVKQLYKENHQQRLILEKKIQDMTDNPDFHFTLAEIGQDNPWLLGLERNVIGEETLSRQNTRLRQLTEHLQERWDSMDASEIGTRLHTLIGKVSKGISSNARRNYAVVMDHVGTKYADEIVLDGRSYLNTLRDLYTEMGRDLRLSGGAPRALAEHIEAVDLRVNPYSLAPDEKGLFKVIDRRDGTIIQGKLTQDIATKVAAVNNQEFGGITGKDLQYILKQHNALIAGESSIFDAATVGSSEHIGKYLKMSMLNDLKGNTSGAVKAILRANTAYATDMQQLSTLKNSVLGKIFGDDYFVKYAGEPQKALDQLIATNDYSSMKYIRQTLADVAPDELEALKGAVVARAINMAKDPAHPDFLIEEDLPRLARALSGDNVSSAVPGILAKGGRVPGRAGRVAQGLFTPAEQQEIINTVKALRVISAKYTKDVYKATASTASDAMINMVAQTPAFVARWTTRALGQSHMLESILIDPNMREAIQVFATKGPNSAAFKAAALYVGVWEGAWTADQLNDKYAEAQDAANQNTVRW